MSGGKCAANTALKQAGSTLKLQDIIGSPCLGHKRIILVEQAVPWVEGCDEANEIYALK